MTTTTNTAPLRAHVGVADGHERITVEGVDLAFEDRGTGETVVCLHATGHGARDFALLREQLGHRYRFITLDWPGQGSSAEDSVPASADRYAELLAGFLDARGIADPILLGNSIGGAAALRFAADHPSRVRALILANTGGLAPVDRFVRIACGGMERFFRAGARGARWFPLAFAAYYRSVLREPAARRQRERIVASSREIASVLAQAWGSFGRPEADLREAAEKVVCPVMVAWAMQDRVLAFRRSAPGIARFRDLRVVKLRGGHAAFLEDAGAFAAAFDAFADRIWTRERNQLR